jgi:hypothetical protein
MARHVDWWHKKGMLYTPVTGAPMGDLWLPLSDGTLATQDVDLHPDMLDLDRLAGEVCSPGPLEFIGDRIAARAPYASVPWVEAILGCPIRATIQGGSMRTRSFIADWEEWERQPNHWHTDWLDALNTLTAALAERSGGRHAIVQTLMRGPVDLAEAVMGPELLCLSMFEHQKELRRFLETVTDAIIEILRQQLQRMPRLEGGHVNPFGVWAPGTVVRTQCDATVLLSPRQYEEWFLPYDERISAAVDYAIIHLHSGSLHTIEPLLKVERPQAIQVTLDAPGGPKVETLLDRFRKVLAVKPLIVDGPLTPAQVELLRRELPHDGLYIMAREEMW